MANKNNTPSTAPARPALKTTTDVTAALAAVLLRTRDENASILDLRDRLDGVLDQWLRVNAPPALRIVDELITDINRMTAPGAPADDAHDAASDFADTLLRLIIALGPALGGAQ